MKYIVTLNNKEYEVVVDGQTADVISVSDTPTQSAPAQAPASKP